MRLGLFYFVELRILEQVYDLLIINLQKGSFDGDVCLFLPTVNLSEYLLDDSGDDALLLVVAKEGSRGAHSERLATYI